MNRIIAITVAVTAAAVLTAAAVADGVYHTAQVPLHGLGTAPGGGQVINIHANGPVVFAHEVYLLQGAAPGTYQVTLHVYPGSTNCTGSVVLIPTATLETNSVGNGKADAVFTPADANGLHGLTLSAYWTVNGPAAYATDCSIITLD